MAWTEEQKEAIWAARMTKTAREIGEEYGVSRNAIIGVWNREREKRGEAAGVRRLTPEEKKKSRSAGQKRRYERRVPTSKFEVVIPEAFFEEPTTSGTPFEDLSRSNCHWPLGKWDEPAKLFCGAPADEGHSYCPFHTLKSRYQPKDTTKCEFVLPARMVA